ncbi:S8 family peptidase [Sphingoaurantiacus capsulatus]|uniref:S8 family peptidase n=1 Tax=Sphingoaurantiacus capsulatus TaxID=1771310 RepID=A0ABV7XBR4_9SPHN
MLSSSKVRMRAATALAGAVFLTACGGGGGGGTATIPTPPAGSATPTPTPVVLAPTPAPTPTPTPTPASINYNTTEYTRSSGAVHMNAITAYNRGATGAGVTVAVLDSGVDTDSAEFSGRIHTASQDIAGSGRGIDDSDGHGTSVAATLLAARNDNAIQGAAFGATLLALRTDTVGSCGSTDGCQHSDNSLARAIDVAVTSGARVINMSLGGSSANANLRNAIARATTAGAIVVISAGNDGAAQPDPLALIATDMVARNQVIIAGSVGTALDPAAMSSFSNKAGTGAARYLAALGYRVRSFDNTGQSFLYSGTSYAAPQVSAAAALLISAFPNLTAAQVVELLFTSATDGGVAGTDPDFGRGILSLTRAFQPIGGTSLAGSAIPVTDDNGILGGAFGDGVQLGSALQGAVILDGFDRAFAIDLAGTIAAAPVQRPLAGRLADRTRGVGVGGDNGYLFLNIAPATSTRPWVGLAQIGVDSQAGDRMQATSGLIASRLDATTRMGVAVGYGAETLLGSMTGGNPDGAFITGADPLTAAGFAAHDRTSTAFTRQAGRWSLGFAASHARANDPRRFGFDRQREGSVDTVAIEAARRVGPVELRLGVSQMNESDSVLGSWSGPALGLQGARTRFANIHAKLPLGSGFILGAGARQGWTNAETGGGLVTRADGIRSFGFQFDVAKERLFGGDRFDLRIAQPLRVSGGSLQLAVPVDYDYATLATRFENRSANLTPSGRELDVEAAYSVTLLGGEVGTHVYWRNEPGHVAARRDDLGAALRYRVGF